MHQSRMNALAGACRYISKACLYRKAEFTMLWRALFLAAVVIHARAQDVSTALPTDVSRTNTPVPPPPHPPPPYDLKASASDYAYTFPVSEYAHGHYDQFDHSVHAHSEDHPSNDEYKVTPRDVAFGFLTFLIILSNLQVSALIFMGGSPGVLSEELVT